MGTIQIIEIAILGIISILCFIFPFIENLDLKTISLIAVIILTICGLVFAIWLNFTESGKLIKAKDEIRTEMRQIERQKNKESEPAVDTTLLMRAADELGVSEQDMEKILQEIKKKKEQNSF